MNKIWANRLIGDTKSWDEVPASRREVVKAELAQRVESGAISAEKCGDHWRGIRCMTAAELIERLTALVKEQADIIKTQADALAQLGAVEGLDGKIEAAASERAAILGE